MRRPTPRLRVALAALFLTFAAALPPAPAGAADPGDGEAPEGLVLRQPGADAGGTPAPRSPQVAAPAAATVPPNFRDELIVGGLDEPTVVQFAADGRMFVAEKRGRILLFDSVTDTTPTVFANLETQVHNLWDRGFLGMVLDPAFTTGRPYVYVAYTANDIIGDGLAAPRWPSDPAEPWKDQCPSPSPGATTDGCVVSGRVSRLTAGGNPLTAGPELQLIQAWCQQFPSHSMGSLAFGSEGALYVTGGEGASFFREDWGQLGGTQPGTPTPVNPCGDPANQGGALRAQDLRTPTTDPVGLSGTLIRIDPDTGAAWPTNNLFGSADTNARRIIAYGLRNPFRFAIRPNSSEIWIGDVGNYSWEEINLVADPSAAPKNFGWPCYEGADDGPARNPDWDVLDIGICENLYASAGAVTAPAFAYGREGEPPFVTGDGCGTDSSAIAGLTFLGTNSGYPDAYDRALFVTDYNRRCIWWVPADGAGRPDFAQRQRFADLRRSGEPSGGAVHLTTGPNGDLVYADFDRGEVRRIHWYSTVPPTASFTATPSTGPLPLTVNFDASGSANPNAPDPLSYQWDLDGNGIYESTGSTTSRTYNSKAEVIVGLRVTASSGLTGTTTRTIWPGYVTPTATITSPGASFRWAVGDAVPFAGTATDGSGTTLPPSSMAWSVTMEHCPSDCHSHPPFFTFTGASGLFSAPDHGYPSHLLLKLVVTDGPVSTTVTREVHPKAGVIQARSDPAGLPVSLAGQTGTPPPDATAIVGSSVTVSAPASGTLAGRQYAFDHWSDGGAAAHGVVATEATKTLTAHYRDTTPPPPPPPPVTSSVFRPIDPVRLLDTRAGNGLGGVFKSRIARTLQVTGRGGIPADAIAVTGNLTATRQTGAGWFAVTPTPTNTPTASNLNFPVGVDRASLVTATLGPGGKLSAVYISTSGKTAHLVFDVTGYFTASGTNGTYRAIDPIRVLDTRFGNGLSGRFVVGERRRWDVAGRGVIPLNATAVTANLTVVNPTASGHVSLYPAGAPRTTVSTLNFRAGEVAANGVAIRLGTSGRLSAVTSGPAGARVDLVVDITGYFVDDAAGARYVPLSPGRLLDTRPGTGLAGRFAANSGRTLPVAGSHGVPSDALAISGTLTVTDASAAGHLTLLPVAANASSTSTLNFRAVESRANGVFGRLSGGSVGILYTGPGGASTDVVFDVTGYFR